MTGQGATAATEEPSGMLPSLQGRSTTEGEILTAARSAAPPSALPSEARRRQPQDGDLIEHVDLALDVLHGKWKVHLIFLMARGIRRHSRLLERLPGVSKKVMTDSLRALERDGIVERRMFPEVPLRVEYSLTPLGWSITEPLVALADWGGAHTSGVEEARTQCGSSRRLCAA